MINGSLIATLALAYVGFSVLLTAAVTIGANFYDFRKLKEQRLASGKRLKKPRQLVSVIIPARNASKEIESCLNSLLKSSHKKYEIIVVDNASADKTKSVVKRFINGNKRVKIKLLSKRKRVSWAVGLRHGLAKAKGQIIMVLDPRQTVGTDTLLDLAKHLTNHKNIEMIAPNIRTKADLTLISVAEQLQGLFYSHRQKLLLQKPKIGSPVIGERTAFRRYLNNKPVNYSYESKLVIYKPAAHYWGLIKQMYKREQAGLSASINRNNSFYPLIFTVFKIMQLLQPIAIGYLFWLALWHHSPTLLIISWLAVSFGLVMAIWADESSKLGQKLYLCLFVPVAFVLYLPLILLECLAVLALFGRQIVGYLVNLVRMEWAPPLFVDYSEKIF